MKAFLVRNWFVLSIPAMVLLAWLVPDLGAQNGPLRTGITTKLGVALIFLVQGLTLSAATLRSGAGRWRLHLLVQGFSYGAFPLIGIAADQLLGQRLPPDLRLGFLFLCVLPTTISTSVVLTSVAGGNTVGAIFNAALSNVVGVFVTPLWVAFLLRRGGARPDLAPVLGEIALLLLLPLAVGQALRPRLAGWADARRRSLGNACSAVILFLILAAFSNSFLAGLWRDHSPALLLGTGAAVTLLFVAVLVLVDAITRLSRLDRGDRIAALFCAPQKTIASGIPLAKALFGTHPGMGFILLPLLLYHTLQLLVSGVLAERLARHPPDNPA